MKLKTLVAAAALSLTLPAFAINVEVLGQLDTDGSPTLIKGLVTGGSFADIVTFSLGEAARASIRVEDYATLAPLFKTTFSKLTLTADPDGSRGNGDDKVLATSTQPGNAGLVLSKVLDAGRYFFTLEGNGAGLLGGLGLYAGAVSAVAVPVPEPESLALLGAGLLVVAGLVRRRDPTLQAD